ncbi:hypothetical protein BASA81_002253 [Batrachochytrium salamandrivorans]|nr:hypothetical protein BASA81_002253 [Batrachochytrium salamandrivorans]
MQPKLPPSPSATKLARLRMLVAVLVGAFLLWTFTTPMAPPPLPQLPAANVVVVADPVEETPPPLLGTQNVCDIVRKPFPTNPANVHVQLAEYIESVSLQYSCAAPSKSFLRYAKPGMFLDGKLLAQYLLDRNWQERVGRTAAKSELEMMLVPCHLRVNLDDFYSLMKTLSTAKMIATFSFPKLMYEAVRDRFLFIGCQYQNYMPEVVYVRSRDTCQASTKQLAERAVDYANVLWRKKDQQTIVTTAQLKAAIPSNCDVMITGGVAPIFAQRQLLPEELLAKGQVYLLISSFFPDARAWFRLGEFDHLEAALKHKSQLKRAVQQTFKIIHSKLQSRERGAFVLLVVDVSVLEANSEVKVTSVECDAKLSSLSSPETATRVVKGMLDIVIASHLYPLGFDRPFTEFVAAHRQDLLQSTNQDDLGEFELVYSENPQFDFSEQVC